MASLLNPVCHARSRRLAGLFAPRAAGRHDAVEPAGLHSIRLCRSPSRRLPSNDLKIMPARWLTVGTRRVFETVRRRSYKQICLIKMIPPV